MVYCYVEGCKDRSSEKRRKGKRVEEVKRWHVVHNDKDRKALRLEFTYCDVIIASNIQTF